MADTGSLGASPSAGRAVSLITALVLANALTWIAAWLSWHATPLLFAGALIAYGYGLRHAVDADHISAIDNTTRKLMQEGKRPLGVGFFFSIGHSTVVFALCAGLSLATAYVTRHLPEWKTLGAVIGTWISCVFLVVIGTANLLIFLDLLRRARSGSANGDGDDLMPQRGIMSRLFGPVMRMVTRSWHMYFVGLLFGLGFDTATEVGILTLSARSGQAGMPFLTMMLLPLLFAVGMCLVDTLDGILMLGAYGWASVDASRKLTYNLGITLVSVFVAFAVALREILQLVGVDISINSSLWAWLDSNLGIVIVGAFLVCWGVAGLVFRRQADAAT